LHGGSISARSPGLGHGAEFIVRLPLYEEAPAQATAAREAPVVERSIRLLVVDDNQDAADTMAMLQQLRGHEVRVAYDGPAAISLAEEFLPEVILLDIGLPGMDGFEVARSIRSMPVLEKAFLIALTGYGSESDRAKALAAGFDEHLPKPADLDLLRSWFSTRVG
ncbi:MAG: response regulator, partial [Verrucomicrobiaceae bacterium]